MKARMFVIAISCMFVVGSTSAPTFAQSGWVMQQSGTTVTLDRAQFLDRNNGYAVGDSGTVLKTSNAGTTWLPVSISTTYPVQDLSFVSVDLGWVAVGDPDASTVSGAVWKTTNGGVSWTVLPSSSTNARLGISFVSALTGWACGANNGAWQIWGTTDGGSGWTMQSGSGFGWTYAIDCISPVRCWSTVVAFFPSPTGVIIATTNGVTWSQQTSTTYPFLWDIKFADANTGFTVGDAGTILKTTNSGTTWTSQNSGTTVNLFGIALVSPLNGWVCGENGTILRTVDGGGTWTSQSTGTANDLKGIFFTDVNTGTAVGAQGTILRTTTGGTVGVDADRWPDRPSHTRLEQNYPNPFNPTTKLSFVIGHSSLVSLKVFDVLGREVATLVGEELAPGAHTVTFDASHLGSGVYFYRLQKGLHSETNKFILVR